MKKFSAMTIAALVFSHGLVPTTWAQEAAVTPAETAPVKSVQRNKMDVDLLQGVVRLSVDSPTQVRVGDSAQYNVTVINTSEFTTLHNVVIKPRLPAGVTVEKATMTGMSAAKPNTPTGSKPADSKPADDKAAANSKDKITAESMTFDTLKPGQSATVALTLSGKQPGTQSFCMLLDSYQPAVCIPTDFVQPELEIVKTGPDTANVCDVITVEYFIKNGGTGTVEQVTIVDDLPEGLMTIDGKKQIKYTPEGQLKAGEVRKFVAKLKADKTGDYTSRAMVEAAGGLKAQSTNVTIPVSASHLMTKIVGPSVESASKLMQYHVEVTNDGQSTATAAKMAFYYPRSVSIAKASDWSTAKAESMDDKAPKASPEAMAGNDSDATDTKVEDDAVAQNSMAKKVWDLGAIEPGQTMSIDLALQSTTAEKLMFEAVSMVSCGEGQMRNASKATFTTDILQLTGLRLTVIDDHDPVAASENVTYTITVDNQGDATANNIEVTATMPDQLKYNSADGVSKASVEGKTIKFDNVEQLAAKEKIVWKILATPVQEKVKTGDDVLLKVELKSKNLSQPANAEEPTTIYVRDGKTVESSSEDAAPKK